MNSASTIPIVRWHNDRLEHARAPMPQESEILDVRYAALCPAEALLAPSWELGLGHELVVERAGEVYVLAAFSVCGECEACLGGSFRRCSGVACPSLSWNAHGGLGGRVALADERFLVAVPQTTRPYTYTLAEPFAAGVAALSSMTGERVAVVGLGAVGLGAALAALTLAKDVSVVVRHPWQRRVASQLGLRVVDPAIDDTSNSFDDVIVATPTTAALEAARSLLTFKGCLHVLAMDVERAEWRAAIAGDYKLFRIGASVMHHYMYELSDLATAVALVQRYEHALQDAIDGPSSLADLQGMFPRHRRGRRTIVACEAQP